MLKCLAVQINGQPVMVRQTAKPRTHRKPQKHSGEISLLILWAWLKKMLFQGVNRSHQSSHLLVLKLPVPRTDLHLSTPRAPCQEHGSPDEDAKLAQWHQVRSQQEEIAWRSPLLRAACSTTPITFPWTFPTPSDFERYPPDPHQALEP